jgi:hypothetical protein
MNMTIASYESVAPPPVIYKSPRGWSIELPTGWSRIADSNPNALVINRPELFCCDNDWSLGITWTRIRVPSYQATEQFNALVTLNGPVPIVDADAVLSGLIPLVGQTTKATALGLTSGERAMEVIKLVAENPALPPRIGIDLLVAAGDGKKTESLFLDRISFYANVDVFQPLLPMIKESLHSFRLPTSRTK